MPRKPIGDEARQVVFNVYLYFIGEADRFKRTEDGYFQKVQERVAAACCVSRQFLHNLLKERDRSDDPALNSIPQPIGWTKKRKMDKDEVEEIDPISAEDELEIPETTAIPERDQVLQTAPSLLAPLITQAEIPSLTPLVTEPDIPPLTPIVTQIVTSIVTPTVSPIVSPIVPKLPPLVPLLTKAEKPPPLAPLVKSQISYTRPPPLVSQPYANRIIIKTHSPVHRKRDLTFIHTKTVPIEYEPKECDDDVSVKNETMSDSNDSHSS